MQTKAENNVMGTLTVTFIRTKPNLEEPALYSAKIDVDSEEGLPSELVVNTLIHVLDTVTQKMKDAKDSTHMAEA